MNVSAVIDSRFQRIKIKLKNKKVRADWNLVEFVKIQEPLTSQSTYGRPAEAGQKDSRISQKPWQIVLIFTRRLGLDFSPPPFIFFLNHFSTVINVSVSLKHLIMCIACLKPIKNIIISSKYWYLRFSIFVFFSW